MANLGKALLVLASCGLAACSTAAAATPPHPVAPAPPPKDDGKTETAQHGAGGEEHSAALEELIVAPSRLRVDKQNSVLVPLPDAEHWTRVRFMTLPSLVGFRYGKDHHAIVAAFVTHVDDNAAPGACNKSFEDWAQPYIQAFEVNVKHDTPSAFSWTAPAAKRQDPKVISIVDADPVMATTATILSHETYAAAWTAYPAWAKACLVVGVAIPAREDEARARAVRDRFVKEVFPKVVVTTPTEPKERY